MASSLAIGLFCDSVARCPTILFLALQRDFPASFAGFFHLRTFRSLLAVPCAGDVCGMGLPTIFASVLAVACRVRFGDRFVADRVDFGTKASFLVEWWVGIDENTDF